MGPLLDLRQPARMKQRGIRVDRGAESRYPAHGYFGLGSGLQGFAVAEVRTWNDV